MNLPLFEPEVKANLGRAEESLRAAQLLYEAGYWDFAAARAYCAAFYAATAALLSAGDAPPAPVTRTRFLSHSMQRALIFYQQQNQAIICSPGNQGSHNLPRSSKLN
jgi:HEPN domain-containing protein